MSERERGGEEREKSPEQRVHEMIAIARDSALPLGVALKILETAEVLCKEKGIDVPTSLITLRESFIDRMSDILTMIKNVENDLGQAIQEKHSRRLELRQTTDDIDLAHQCYVERIRELKRILGTSAENADVQLIEEWEVVEEAEQIDAQIELYVLGLKRGSPIEFSKIVEFLSTWRSRVEANIASSTTDDQRKRWALARRIILQEARKEVDLAVIQLQNAQGELERVREENDQLGRQIRERIAYRDKRLERAMQVQRLAAQLSVVLSDK